MTEQEILKLIDTQGYGETVYEILAFGTHRLCLHWLQWNDRNGSWFPNDPEFVEMTTDELKKIIISQIR